MNQALFEWALAVLGSGGLGAVITYICTFKSKKKIAAIEADTAEIDMEQKKTALYQDLYQYLQELCDRYLKEYHELEATFKSLIVDIRTLLDSMMIEKSLIILNKCVEIASLKSKVAYLNGIKCYDFTCPKRNLINPIKE